MTADDDYDLCDSETREKGYGLKVIGGQINTNEAWLAVATSGLGLFKCHMYKRSSDWIVLNVSEDNGVTDGPSWGDSIRMQNFQR
jgi:hypothetical protein